MAMRPTCPVGMSIWVLQISVVTLPECFHYRLLSFALHDGKLDSHGGYVASCTSRKNAIVGTQTESLKTH